MLTFGQGDEDPVSLPHNPALEDNRHNARLADQIPGFIPIEDGLQQTRLNGVKLVARISQSRDFDLGRLAELENRPFRKPKQVNPACGDIFAHLTGQYWHSLGRDFIVQFTVVPMCASPSTPRPASSVICGSLGLISVYSGLRLTEVIIAVGNSCATMNWGSLNFRSKCNGIFATWDGSLICKSTAHPNERIAPMRRRRAAPNETKETRFSRL